MKAYDAKASSEKSEDGDRMSPIPFPTGDFDTSNPSADRRGQMPPYTPVMLKAHTRTTIQVNLFPTLLKEGYLPPTETTFEGVYIYEDIVKNNNNTCKVFVINTRNEDISISIAPRKIYSFNYGYPSDSKSDDLESDVESGFLAPALCKNALHNSSALKDERATKIIELPFKAGKRENLTFDPYKKKL